MEDLIERADRKIEQDGFDRDAMIAVRQWLLSKHWPSKYGIFAAMPAPPAAPEIRVIDDAKTINARPEHDPVGDATKNFERALQESAGRTPRTRASHAGRSATRSASRGGRGDCL